MKQELTLQPVQQWLPGLKKPYIISGPCSAETEEQVMATATEIAAIDRHIIYRAGIWKPRTRPGAFEGIGKRGLAWLQKVKKELKLAVATEVATAKHVEACLEHGVDILWIGARTSVNPFSVQEIADALQGTSSTVLIKNPVSPDLHLWIGALERLNRAGIHKLGAIHRGCHSSNPSPFRNEARWDMAIELRTLHPQLPLLCDPSHICGCTELIPYVSQKALDLGLDGLMIETHILPSAAKSDAKQQLTPVQLKELLKKLIPRNVTSADT